MPSESADPALEPIRELRGADGTPLGAASGLIAAHGRHYAISDDQVDLAHWVGDGPVELVRLLPDELPGEHDARKAAKPDLEALTRLADGSLLAVGSCSTDARQRAVVIGLGDDGVPDEGALRVVDLSPIADRLRELAGGEINIEGAAARGDGLLLGLRGNAGTGDGIAHLPLADLLDGRPDALELHPVDLGEVDGAALSLTDLGVLPDGRVAVCAAAERTDNAYDDGEIAGSAVGVLLEDDRTVQVVHRFPGAVKLEGLTGTEDGTLWAVDDPDDETKVARLWRLPALPEA